MNLLTETLDYMKEIGKTQDDVLYVKMTKHTGFWHELNDSYPDEILVDFNTFASVANHVYNNGYGSSEVNTSTTILFKGCTVGNMTVLRDGNTPLYLELSQRRSMTRE